MRVRIAPPNRAISHPTSTSPKPSTGGFPSLGLMRRVGPHRRRPRPAGPESRLLSTVTLHVSSDAGKQSKAASCADRRRERATPGNVVSRAKRGGPFWAVTVDAWLTSFLFWAHWRASLFGSIQAARCLGGATPPPSSSGRVPNLIIENRYCILMRGTSRSRFDGSKAQCPFGDLVRRDSIIAPVPQTPSLQGVEEWTLALPNLGQGTK